MNQYTRYLTVVIAMFQAYGISVGLEGAGGVVIDPGWFFRFSTMITLGGGTMFLMWLGQQVTSSFVMRGAPKLLSSTTLRPFGPSVTFTALARMSTPRSMRSRASPENFTSLAAISNYSVGFGAT